VAAAVAAIAIGVLVVPAAPADAKDRRPAMSREWDPRVKPIAKAVERIRGLEFDHPIKVSFLSDADFRKRFEAGELGDPSLRRTQRVQRALGLLGPDDDLLELAADAGASGVGGYYWLDKIVIRGTKHDVFHDYVLAHELAHALQDQSGRDALGRDLTDDLDVFMALVVSEGEAEWVAHQWLAHEPAARRQAFVHQERAFRDGAYDDDLAAALPPIVSLQGGAPYSHGLELFETAVGGDGRRGLEALVANPPTDDAGVVDPFRDPSLERPAVAPPTVPKGEHRIGQAQRLGALGTYWMLASRIDPVRALAAADQWNGDSFVLTRRGTDTCVRATFNARQGVGSEALADGLTAWAAAMGTATVTTSETTHDVAVTTCGTPPEAPVDGALYAADAIITLRNAIVAHGLHDAAATTAISCGIEAHLHDARLVPLLQSVDLGEAPVALQALVEELRVATQQACGYDPGRLIGGVAMS
jgi:hypothetical protein